jgi:hypothetical protein
MGGDESDILMILIVDGKRFPHERGDEPYTSHYKIIKFPFSPHRRGLAYNP